MCRYIKNIDNIKYNETIEIPRKKRECFQCNIPKAIQTLPLTPKKNATLK